MSGNELEVGTIGELYGGVLDPVLVRPSRFDPKTERTEFGDRAWQIANGDGDVVDVESR